MNYDLSRTSQDDVGFKIERLNIRDRDRRQTKRKLKIMLAGLIQSYQSNLTEQRNDPTRDFQSNHFIFMNYVWTYLNNWWELKFLNLFTTHYIWIINWIVKIIDYMHIQVYPPLMFMNMMNKDLITFHYWIMLWLYHLRFADLLSQPCLPLPLSNLLCHALHMHTHCPSRNIYIIWCIPNTFKSIQVDSQSVCS